MTVRSDILEAATLVFGERGYDRATLEDIAQIVGIKKASLYHHIDSKEDLLWELHCSLYQELSEMIDENMREVENPDDGLRTLIRTLVMMLTKRQLATRVMLRAHRSLSGEKLKRVLANRQALISKFIAVITDGVDAGEFVDVDPTTAAYGILGMCYWVQDWYDSGGQITDREIASLFESMILDGLRLRKNDDWSGARVVEEYASG